MDLVFPPQHHFDCNGCGRCCWSWLINVNRASYDRLKDTEFLRQAEAQRGTPPIVETNTGQHAIIHKEDDSCTFLLPDKRCEMHAVLGYTSKPTSCQQFPFMPVHTPDGVHVGLSYYCDAVQRDEGGDLQRFSADLQGWLKGARYPTITDTSILLAPDIHASWEAYKTFEAWLSEKMRLIPEPTAAMWTGVLAVCRMAVHLRQVDVTHVDADLMAQCLRDIPQSFLWGAAFQDYTHHSMAVVASLWEGADSKVVRAAMLDGSDFFSAQLGKTVGTTAMAEFITPGQSLEWRLPHYQRYLNHVIFRKWLALLPLTMSISALYVAANLLDYYFFLSAYAGGRSTPTEKDVWKAIDIVEVNFLGHNFGQVDMYPHLAIGFLEQIKAVDQAIEFEGA